jgi:hypothetical protein
LNALYPLSSRVSFRLFGAFIVVVATTLAVHGYAHAQTPDVTADAKVHLTAGDSAAKANSWDAALKEYLAANTAAASGPAQLGAANALYQLHRASEAFEAYDDLVKLYGKTLSKKDRAVADARTKELGAVTGYLSLRVNEGGAAVSVDGKSAGTTPVAALMRVASGAHKVAIAKDGYLSFEQTVNVSANGKAIVDVTLQREPKTGHVAVKEKTAQAIRVAVDGVDVGPAPYEGDVEPGRHEVIGKGVSITTPKAVIEVARGKTTNVELVASALVARLEVRTSDNKGFVLIDGKPMAEGSFAGEVPAGAHVIAVSREGYERYEKQVNLEDNQTLVETVTLKQTGSTLDGAGVIESERPLVGVYGGFNFAGYLMPGGSKNSVEVACDTLGATTCANSTPLGAGINGYIGYSFNPIGFELFLGGMGDITSPTASFDGVKGSNINPLIAAPARDEKFRFIRGGGLGALRVRAAFQGARARFTAAAGVGLAYKQIGMERSTGATDGSGARNVTVDDGKGYLSPGISLDMSIQYRVAPALSIALGGVMWLESAGQSARTARSTQRLGSPDLATKVIPSPLATPEYDMANGSQVYIGPYLGMQFGP